MDKGHYLTSHPSQGAEEAIQSYHQKEQRLFYFQCIADFIELSLSTFTMYSEHATEEKRQIWLLYLKIIYANPEHRRELTKGKNNNNNNMALNITEIFKMQWG